MKNERQRRQEKILELITTSSVETQTELATLLKEAGFRVTQATVSRDIHQMKLTKVASDGIAEGYRYELPIKHNQGERIKLRRVLLDGFVSMDTANNLLVIRTFNGMAMAVAAALDSMGVPEIVGCIAGDDVIFCATKSEKTAASLMNKLKRSMEK
ncbi:MAG: arginine repressor [Firmicutes bacterium]|nr:arginine repressor [Bacillota bacterium]